MSRGTEVGERTNPLHRFTGRLHEHLDTMGQPVSWSMTSAEVIETLSELHTGIARLQSLQLGLVADADRSDLASQTGYVNTAAVVRALTRMTGLEARHFVKTARALEQHPVTAEALLAGSVSLHQAVQILAAVDALPDSVSPGDREKAERHLLDLAATHDAQELKRLGAHLVDVIDPDGADQRLADQLEREERRAARKLFLSARDNGDGTSSGEYRIPNLHQAMLDRYLAAQLNPNRPDPITRDGRTHAELRGEALCQLLERIDATKLPKLAGRTATVVVTMELETLLGGIKPALLDTGQPIAAREARRLACQAGVIPAIFDGDGELLDLGPHVRFHSEAQRLGMSVKQKGTCAVEGCDRPAWLCDAAHLIAHHGGGHTSVKDGALVCPRHHQMADSPRYEIHRVRPGRIRLARRQ